MPTGYTYKLDEGTSARDWIIESLARAFGMCVMLRDEDSGLTQEEIIEKLKESSDYHVKNLKKAKDLLEKYKRYSSEDWRKLLEKHNEKIIRENKRRVDEASILRYKHECARKDIQKVLAVTKDTVTKNVLRFGIDQLERVRTEEEAWLEDLYTGGVEEFKEEKLETVKHDIDYHTKEKAEQERRNRERVICYKKLIEEVDNVLGDK